jgi:hypothetical protein
MASAKRNPLRWRRAGLPKRSAWRLNDRNIPKIAFDFKVAEGSERDILQQLAGGAA